MTPLKRSFGASYGVPLAYAGALAFRLLLSPGIGFPTDVNAWESWAVALTQLGPHALYADGSGRAFPVVDYPPAYMYVLWLLGLVHHALCACSTTGGVGFRVLVKLPAIVADLGIAALLRTLALRVAAPRTATYLWLAALFAPPLPLISAYWGQVDSVAVVIDLLAVFMLVERHDALAWPLLTAGLLVKPQSAVLVVPFAVWQLAGRRGLRALPGVIAAVCEVYALCLPFAPSAAPLSVSAWLLAHLTTALGKYPYASTGAFNVYGLAGVFFTSDAHRVAGLALRAWGGIFVVLIVACVAGVLWRRLSTLR